VEVWTEVRRGADRFRPFVLVRGLRELLLFTP